MKKALKILGGVVGALIALLVITMVVLALVFDPNKHKDEIIHAVKSATGRDLTIAGNIALSFYPWLGAKAEGVTLGNAPGFGPEPFAKVGAGGVSVQLLPLLRGQLRVETVHARDVVLNLARDAKGRSNWDDLTQADKTAPTPDAADKQDAEGKSTDIVIGGLELQHANVNYHDAAQGSNYAVQDLELHTGRIAHDTPIDIRVACKLQYGKPAKQAVLGLKAVLSLAEKSVALRNLDLKLDDSRLTGTFDIVDTEKSALRFDFTLDRIDLDRYLAAAPTAGATVTAPAKTEPAPKAGSNAPTEIPVAMLRTLEADGKFRIGSLKAHGVRIADVLLQIAAHNGIVKLGPNEGKLYGGTWSGHSQIDARTAKARFNFDDQLKNVQLGPLLKDAAVFDKYQGSGEVTWKMAAVGSNTRQLVQTLSGNAGVNLRDGKIEGVNLSKLIADARRLVDQARGKTVAVTPAAADETAFKSLHASAKLENGVARTDDFKLDGPVVRADGGGNADLVRETLDYRLKVTVAEGADRHGTTLPVRIDGTFAHPAYNVELGEVAKQQLEKKLEDKLEDKLNRYLKKRNQ